MLLERISVLFSTARSTKHRQMPRLKYSKRGYRAVGAGLWLLAHLVLGLVLIEFAGLFILNNHID